VTRATDRRGPRDDGSGSVITVVRRALGLIPRTQRARWLLLVGLAVFASVLEMVGAVLVYVLLALVADPGGALDLPLIGDIGAVTDGVEDLGFFFLVRAGALVGISYIQQRTAYRAGARLATRLTRAYLEMPYAFHLRRNTSESIRNVNAAATALVTMAFLPIIGLTASILMTIGLLTVMVIVSQLANLLAIIVVGGAVGLLLRVIQPKLKYLGHLTHAWNRITLQSIQQSLQGFRDIRLLGREQHFAAKYAEGVDQLARAAYTRGTVNGLPRTVMDTALLLFILVFFGVAVSGGMASDAILSTLGLFAYAGLRLQPSLGAVVGGLNELRFATAVVNDVAADLDLAVNASNDGGAVLALQRELRFDGVAFRYEGADRDALAHVELVVRAGETVGICGATGGGKSTLVDLLVGLLPPTEGRITIDGRDLWDDPAAWQRELGVVSQAIFLTDDTIRNNIALGIDAADVDEVALAEAVALAQLDRVVAELPDGLDTVVGEAGARLSGGQRQRVAIARALYRDAGVLVLDEGTSALDNVTEADLMAELRQLSGRRTVVMVAHRLSTVRDCDRIVYVDAGRIAGCGTYDELLRDNDSFRAMVGSR
jgi:ATP-binding cassette, subfamily B, bacterial PglK